MHPPTSIEKLSPNTFPNIAIQTSRKLDMPPSSGDDCCDRDDPVHGHRVFEVDGYAFKDGKNPETCGNHVAG